MKLASTLATRPEGIQLNDNNNTAARYSLCFWAARLDLQLSGFSQGARRDWTSVNEFELLSRYYNSFLAHVSAHV